MAKTLKYFHVTSYKSYKLILTEGLKSYDGIFLLSNKSWKDDSKEIISLKEMRNISGYMAKNQLDLYSENEHEPDFVILNISPKGITGNLITDNVAEITSEYQLMLINQDLIEPKFIRVNCFSSYI